MFINYDVNLKRNVKIMFNLNVDFNVMVLGVYRYIYCLKCITRIFSIYVRVLMSNMFWFCRDGDNMVGTHS